MHLQISTNSLFNMVDVLEVLEALVKCPFYEIEVDQLIHQFTKCLK